MMAMASFYESASVAYQIAFEKVNITFTAIFAFEAFIKLVAYGIAYF